MRILYHHRTMADGAEGIHIREIVSALRSLGHEVRVVALAGDPSQPAARTSSRLGALRRLIPSAAYEVAELGYNVVGYRQVLTAIREFKPEAIYDRYNSYSTAALRAARRARLPLLLEVNAPVAYERSVYEHLQLKWPWLAKRYERRIFQDADRIFVVSTPLKRHLVDTVGIHPVKIVVLPNGADPDVFAPRSGVAVRRRYGIENRVIIGFVGILRPWHRIDLLLDAFAEVRRRCSAVHLLIVGDGPIQEQLQSQARELGVAGTVTFTGRLPHADVVDHIAATDVCVSPHATFYASPMKILEYMAMEKPVVAPAMDNIRDIIDDGQTGVLFDPASVGSLAAALLGLVRSDVRRGELGRAGRSRVVEVFNWRRNAARVVDQVSSVVQSRSKPE